MNRITLNAITKLPICWFYTAEFIFFSSTIYRSSINGNRILGNLQSNLDKNCIGVRQSNTRREMIIIQTLIKWSKMTLISNATNHVCVCDQVSELTLNFIINRTGISKTDRRKKNSYVIQFCKWVWIAYL